MKKIGGYVVSILIVILGMIAVNEYLSDSNSILEIKTWAWFLLAYQTILNPSYDYWLKKLNDK